MEREEKAVVVRGLNAYYKESGDLFSGKKLKRQILFDISFEIGKNEILGLVGESGSGKSTIGRALCGMVKHTEGEIIHSTKRPQMIFQDPYGSLNPARRIGWILEEPLRIRGVSAPKRSERVDEILERTGLTAELKKRYPAELSGGQRQRVCIALALIQSPGLIIADEAVSALDVTVQDKILNLLLELQREKGFALLFISHDLRVVYRMCGRAAVLKDGRIVEQGKTERLYANPRHAYTRELLAAAGIYGESLKFPAECSDLSIVIQQEEEYSDRVSIK